MVAPDRPDTQRGAERLQGSEQGSRIPLGTAVNEIARQQHHVRSLLHRTADPAADVMLVQERAVMQVAQLDGPERRHEPRQCEALPAELIAEDVPVADRKSTRLNSSHV